MKTTIIKSIFGLLSALSFFGMLFFACALDSASNVPLVAVLLCAVGMFLFGIPAGLVDLSED